MSELNSQECARKAEQQAFRQQLPDQSAPRRPDSHAHAHFAFAGAGPGQHQVGQISGSNQHHQRSESEHQP